ncbi:MAG: TldD/PmbA family protein [Candidatus Thorarchaeota archaeon]
MEILLEIAEDAVKRALALGADEAEAYAASAKSFSIEVENNSIKSAEESHDSGIGIRSVVGKKIGFAYVTTIQESDYVEAVEKSVKLAKASLPDPDFVSLPSFEGSYPDVGGLFDSSISNLTSEDAADLIVRTVDASLESMGKYKTSIEAQLSASTGSKALVNSIGISQTARSTSAMMYSYPVIKSDDDQTSSFEYQVTRKLNTLNPEWIGNTASQNAINNLGGKVIEGGSLPVIFTPLAVGTILGSGFARAVNAEEVQYGRSYISDAFGSRIASEQITIVDDGVLEGATGSRIFDAEGYPSQHTIVLKNGILKSLLHNSYTAFKDSVDNTGNASRPSYAGLPSISTSNFIVEPDRGTLDELVSEIDCGVLCRNTGDRPNMTTGDLSAMIMEGFYIERGEIKYPVKNTLIGINMKDLLMRIERIGADVRETFSIMSPSIVVSSAKITSG